MNHHSMHSDEFDAGFDDLAPTGETEYEESGGVDTAVEVELLVARTQTTRFWED